MGKAVEAGHGCRVAHPNPRPSGQRDTGNPPTPLCSRQRRQLFAQTGLAGHTLQLCAPGPCAMGSRSPGPMLVAHSCAPTPTCPQPPRQLPHKPRYQAAGLRLCQAGNQGPFPGHRCHGPLDLPPTVYAQCCPRQTRPTSPSPGKARPGGTGPASQAGWGFYTGRKSKPRWGWRPSEGGNTAISAPRDRQEGGRPLPTPATQL